MEEAFDQHSGRNASRQKTESEGIVDEGLLESPPTNFEIYLNLSACDRILKCAEC